MVEGARRWEKVVESRIEEVRGGEQRMNKRDFKRKFEGGRGQRRQGEPRVEAEEKGREDA